MRSALIAAFAIGALAVPYNNLDKRAVVVDSVVDVVYTTDIVTVTAGAPAKSTPEVAANKAHYGHKHHGGWGGWGHGGGHGGGSSAKTTAVKTTAVKTSAVQTSVATHPATHKKPKPSPTATAWSTHKKPSPTAAPSSAGSSYKDITLYHHNIHRKNHSASDVTWDDDLAMSAGKVAASCVYAHNTAVDGGGYGQNIAAGVSGDNISAVITDLFYNGEVNNYAGYYGEAQPPMGNFGSWGHFSQIVWKATTKVACVTQDCSGRGLANTGGDVSPYFTVCNYKSPGNYANEYGDNVGSPLGEPSASWDTGMS